MIYFVQHHISAIFPFFSIVDLKNKHLLQGKGCLYITLISLMFKSLKIMFFCKIKTIRGIKKLCKDLEEAGWGNYAGLKGKTFL